MKDDVLRNSIIDLLTGGDAHMVFSEMIKDFPPEQFNTIFPKGEYSPWALLEHIRRTQRDILEFMVNPQYQEREWPKDYWPDRNQKAGEKEWKETIRQYQEDLKALVRIAEDPKTDLFARIPHGQGQTNLREFLVVADHTSYHMGEFAIMRQVMRTWGKDHK